MQEVVIDFAQAEDLEAMAELLAELFAQEHDFRPDRARQLRGLRLILDNPASGRLFVLRVDGRVAAMANALITVSTAEGAPVVLLEDWVVGSADRGLGLGRRLLQHVIDWAGAAGMARITLLTDSDNERARAIYGKFGFRTSGMRVMRRQLAAGG